MRKVCTPIRAQIFRLLSVQIYILACAQFCARIFFWAATPHHTTSSHHSTPHTTAHATHTQHDTTPQHTTRNTHNKTPHHKPRLDSAQVAHSIHVLCLDQIATKALRQQQRVHLTGPESGSESESVCDWADSETSAGICSARTYATTFFSSYILSVE